MSFGKVDIRPILKMEKRGKTWYVEEWINPDYVSESEKELWFSAHASVEFFPSWDGSGPYSSGHAAHYTGERKATDDEIKRHLKELESMEKNRLADHKKQVEEDVAELRKKAKKLGFRLVPLKGNKNV